jgi:hypothetical protein
MDIIPLIRELLMSHDCVVVPGFGGFLANYSPARVDKASSTLHPPRKVLSFNKNLVHNDGLLIGVMAKRGPLSRNRFKITGKVSTPDRWFSLRALAVFRAMAREISSLNPIWP